MQLQRLIALWPLLLLLPLLGCTSTRKIERFYGGPEHFQLVETADAVDAFRVESPFHPPKATATAPTIGGLRIIGEPVTVDHSTAKQLSKILHDPATYERLNKACIFSPDIAVRFARGNESVVVIFCFTCNQLEIVDAATAQALGYADDDAKRPQLLAIMKRLFPQDQYVQGLR